MKDVESAMVVLHNPAYTSMYDIKDEDILSGRVIAIDKKRDLALIKLDKKIGSNKVSRGSSWRIEIADDVFAIGSPAGGGMWGFTYGVISALHNPRIWNYGNAFGEMEANCIQTQTPINPGNSGGPLFNDNGRLIGITTSGAQGEGLNYAVRIDEIDSFLSNADRGLYPKGEDAKPEWFLIKDHSFGKEIEVWGIDFNRDGNTDAWDMFEPGDDIVDIRVLDTNYDGYPDIFYTLVDGKFAYDTDFDGYFDWQCFDKNHDHVPEDDTCEPFTE